MRLKSSAIFAVLVVLGGLVIASGQKTGGYREIDKADEGALAAAEFAVKDQSEKKEMTYKLVSVEKAESQVVAGINYRLCLKVGYRKQDEDADTNQFVRVVVFRSLQKEYSLTSWAEEDCAKDGEP
jgi:aspartic proteinase inhibitor